MACRASGRSTFLMSGTCATRGMANILPDLTTGGHGAVIGTNCIQFTSRPAVPPSGRPQSLSIMILQISEKLQSSASCCYSRTMAETGLRERKKLATRAALGQAAWRLIRERGYDNVRVEDIAAAADVSV